MGTPANDPHLRGQLDLQPLLRRQLLRLQLLHVSLERLLLLRRALRQRRPVPVVVVGDRRLQRGLLGGAGLAVAFEAGEPVAEHLKGHKQLKHVCFCAGDGCEGG